MSAGASPADVIAFWREAGPAKWYAKDAAFDAAIRTRFEALHHAAARGELAHWAADWQGALALLLLLDQFPRNMFRDSARAFATDPQALALAKRAIGRFLNGGEKGRFVPPEVVMGNTKNEENFDKIKGKVDAWSFHDNSGDKESGPKLIASKGEPATVPKKILLKSEHAPILCLWKVSSK